MAYAYRWLESPVGRLKLIAGDHGLAAILWAADHRPFRHVQPLIEQPDHPMLVETGRQLDAYFERRRRRFSITLAFEGTEFQKRVWAALIDIPYGETRTYGDIARGIGRPAAARAVGAANAMNPISIVAPCHRVIGASGALTGFAGGLAAKTALLALEGTATASRASVRSRLRQSGPWKSEPWQSEPWQSEPWQSELPATLAAS